MSALVRLCKKWAGTADEKRSLEEFEKRMNDTSKADMARMYLMLGIYTTFTFHKCRPVMHLA